MTVKSRFTGRQITVMVVAICAAVVAAPAMVWATTASFSSSTSTPAVSGTNSSSSTGAKGVYGNASATSGTVYGVLGHSASSGGYGVYSNGRLGSTGALVCSHCVTGSDLNSSGLPSRGFHYQHTFGSVSDNVSVTLLTYDGFELDFLCDGTNNYHTGISILNKSGAAGAFDLFRTSNPPITSGFYPDGVTGASTDSTGSTSSYLYFSSNNQNENAIGVVEWNPTSTADRVATIDFHVYVDGTNCAVNGTVSGPA